MIINHVYGVIYTLLTSTIMDVIINQLYNAMYLGDVIKFKQITGDEKIIDKIYHIDAQHLCLHGLYEMMYYLCEHDYVHFVDDFIYTAFFSGNVELTIYLFNKYNPKIYKEKFRIKSSDDKQYEMNIINLMKHLNNGVNSKFVLMATKNKFNDLIKYLYEKGKCLTNEYHKIIIFNSCELNNLELIKYLATHNIDYHIKLLRHNHPLNYMRKNRGNLLDICKINHHRELLDYLRTI